MIDPCSRRYQSRIRLDTNELVTLPNAALAEREIVNLTRKTAKKVVATLRVRYADVNKIERVIDELRDVAMAQVGLAKGRPVEVFLTDYGKAAIEITASIHLDPKLNDKQLKQDFLLRLSEVLAKNDVQFQPSLELK